MSPGRKEFLFQPCRRTAEGLPASPAQCAILPLPSFTSNRRPLYGGVGPQEFRHYGLLQYLHLMVRFVQVMRFRDAPAKRAANRWKSAQQTPRTGASFFKPDLDIVPRPGNGGGLHCTANLPLPDAAAPGPFPPRAPPTILSARRSRIATVPAFHASGPRT